MKLNWYRIIGNAGWHGGSTFMALLGYSAFIEGPITVSTATTISIPVALIVGVASGFMTFFMEMSKEAEEHDKEICQEEIGKRYKKRRSKGLVSACRPSLQYRILRNMVM